MKNKLTKINADVLSMTNPAQIMEFGKTLAKYINDNNLSVLIKDNRYAMVSGWQFAGLNFGLTPLAQEPVRNEESGKMMHILYAKSMKTFKGKSYEQEYVCYSGLEWDESIVEKLSKRHKISREIHKPHYSYSCTVDLISLVTGQVVGRGHTICTNLEEKKITFDEYAVKSMAQTRAIGKAFRSLIGYIMQGAGFEPTPAEEMEEVKAQEEAKQEPKKKLTADKFKKALEMVSAGTLDIETIEQSFELTNAQKQKLNESSKKKK